MKDRLLEDWAMTGEVTEEMKTEERIKRIESRLNEAQTKLARLIAGIRSIQQHLVLRLERLEEQTSCRPTPGLTDAGDGELTNSALN